MGKKQTHNPIQLTKKLRAEVLYRDHYTCQFPGCGYKDYSGTFLEVHHRDHDKTNNFRSNLITFCAPCNQAESGRHTRARNRLAKLHERADYWREKKHAMLPF